MSSSSRRDFIRTGALGLAALGTTGLTLRADAQPTPASGDLGAYAKFVHDVNARDLPTKPRGGKWQPTEENILGPFHRTGAPFRGKITPPLEPGTVLVIAGRVWGFDTKKPIAHAWLDIWQANAQGRYDNDDPRNPPAKDVFLNRARIITDENGYYEYQTIHPAPYMTGPKMWRPSHIHYLVQKQGYQQLVTQLYFKGDPHNKTDQFIRESLIIEVVQHKRGTASYEAGVFDIVLAPAAK